MLPLILAFLSPGEWAVALLIIVLFFGAAKIPELARSLGKAKGEFERGSREGREQSAKDAAPIEEAERARVLKAARELGIPTEGRSITEIKADVRAKLA